MKFNDPTNERILTTGRELGIWLDHANAHLMEWANPVVQKV